MAARALPGRRRGAGRRRARTRRRGARAGRHDPERHHQGVPVARHVRLPARAVAAADHRHDRVHGRARSRSGTRSTSAATTCRRPARRRCRRSPSRWRTAIAVLDAVRDSGQVPPERFGEVVARISFFVNAGVRFVEEMCKMRAFVQLWDELTRERYGVDRRQAAPLPLRRAGQLARPDRGAAGEQRAAHRAGDAGRDAVEGRPGPRRAAARVERGAGPAAAVGPAVVAAHPAGARLRVRPAGVRRPVRGLDGRGGQGRRARRGRARRDRPGRRSWAARSPAVESGYLKSRARRLARGAAPADRVRARTSSSASTASRRPSRTR